MKVEIYTRISTTGKGQDVDRQVNDLRAYALARGWKIYQEYVATSGSPAIKSGDMPWTPSLMTAGSGEG